MEEKGYKYVCFSTLCQWSNDIIFFLEVVKLLLLYEEMVFASCGVGGDGIVNGRLATPICPVAVFREPQKSRKEGEISAFPIN